MGFLFGVIVCFIIFIAIIFVVVFPQQKPQKNQIRPITVPIIPDTDHIKYYAMLKNNIAKNDYRYECGEITQDEYADIFADLYTEIAELSYTYGISEEHHGDLIALYMEKP